MVDTTISIFERLPAEVFHKILNHLDTSDIFYSFYNVCRQVNAFLISYNRYKLDLSSISRSDFDLFHCVIHPRNIISLILSDDDQTPGQIGLFLSLFNIQELHRLRSLTLLQIEECQLFVFLQHASLHNLSSLTVKWRGGSRFHSSTTQTLMLLSSAISQPNLRYLDLSLWIYEIKNLSWTNSCTVQHLCIDDCSFSEYCLILCHLSHLKTLVLRDCSMYDVDNTFSSSSFIRPSYHQLRSLSLENIRNIQMRLLGSFLSVTPSLVHLKLVGIGCVRDGAFDGSRWQNFIRQHLYLLDKFEFFFATQRNSNQTVDDVSSLISPFSNKFWIEKKHWYVTCDFIKSFSQIRLYSIPICQPYFDYAFESDVISRSTFITTDNDADRINGVHIMNVNLSPMSELRPKLKTFSALTHTVNLLIDLIVARNLGATNLSAAVTEQEEYMNMSPIYHQVTELKLEMDNQYPLDLLQFLSTILDLSHVVKISLNIYFDNDFATYTTNAIVNLLEEAPNIHTLHNNNRTANSKIICSIVLRHIKHLKVKIDRIKDMKTILERLYHLSSVTFQFPVGSLNYPTKIIKWLKRRGTSFTFWCNSYSIHLWLDNNISRLKDIQERTELK